MGLRSKIAIIDHESIKIHLLFQFMHMGATDEELLDEAEKMDTVPGYIQQQLETLYGG